MSTPIGRTVSGGRTGNTDMVPALVPARILTGTSGKLTLGIHIRDLDSWIQDHESVNVPTTAE